MSEYKGIIPNGANSMNKNAEGTSTIDAVRSRCSRVALRAARFLQSVRTPEKMVKGLVPILQALPLVDSGGIYLLSDDRRTFRLMEHWGLSPTFIRKVQAFDVDSEWGKALYTGSPITSRKPLLSDDIQSTQLRQREKMETFCNIPIREKKRVLGSVNVSAHQDVPFKLYRLIEKTMQSIGPQMANALARIENQMEIENQRKNLLAIFRSLPEMLVVADRQGTILYANPAMGRVIGCGASALKGRTIETLHPPEKQAEATRIKKEVYSGSMSRFTLPLIREDGRWMPAEVSVAQGIWDGKPSLFAAIRDLSERVRLEQVLRESEENFRALVQNARNGVVVLTCAERPPQFANQRTAEMLQCSPRALLRRPVSSWLHPSIPGTLEKTLADAMAGRTVTPDSEALIGLPSGGTVPVELTYTRTQWKGSPALLVDIHDVSWRRRLQRQVVNSVTWERENIARVLHDGIAQQVAGTAYLSKALEKALRTRHLKEAEQAKQVSASLMECQQQIRTLSRALLPDVQGHMVTNLERLAQSVQTFFGIRCIMEGLETIADINGARAGHIFYIIQEAVMNAVRHGKPTFVRVTVSSIANGQTKVSIADNGSGFVPEDVHKDSFGLHLLRYRAERLGGTVHIHAQEGQGSEITCTFLGGGE